MPLRNCPNCGAPLLPNGRCEYCGSIVVMALDDLIQPIKVEMEGERTVRWYNPKTHTWEWVTPK
jgi:ribosomal protein L32